MVPGVASVPISSLNGVAYRRLLAFLCFVLAVQPTARPRADTIAEVRSIRFGVDAGRTRIVIDVDQKIAFSAVASLPVGLVVDLPEVRWRLRDGPRSRPHGLARSYLYGSGGLGRGWLLVKMSKPVHIVRQLILGPAKDWPLYRLVIDVEKAASATVVTPATGAATPP